MSNSIDKSFIDSIKKLIKVTKTIAEGNYFYYHPKLEKSDPHELISQLSFNFNLMISRIKEHQDGLEKKIQLRATELLKLKSSKERMDPHFLFNSLNMIHQLISQDPIKADKALLLLAENYRYLMEISETELTDIEKEWTFMLNYLELMKLRFHDSLSIKIFKPINLPNWKIPTITLQPILENSFKHGFKNIKKNKKLYIKIEFMNNQFSILIKDNGEGFSVNHIGNRSLNNILDRFKYYYKDASLDISSEEKKGTEITLKFSNFKYWR
jgi:LytS/YehU family sensor histidine kinase